MYGELRRRDELQGVEAAKLFGSAYSSSGDPVRQDGVTALVQVETSCRTAQPLSGLDEGERFVRVAPAYVWERF